VFFSVAGVAELADALDSKSNIMPGGDTAIAVLLPNYASAFGHRRVGEAIFILHGRPATELSIACFPDNSTQSRTAAWDGTIVRLSLCPLLKNPAESERFVASSAFAAVSESLQRVSPTASATRDVVQRS